MENILEGKKHGVGFGVILMKDNKVLFGKRHSDPEKANSAMRGEGTWTLPGGKLAWGESFEDGAVREVKEETNIDVHSSKVICVNNDRNQYAHFITIGMYSEDFSGEAQTMEPDVITEWRWFSLDDLPSPLFPPSEKMIQNFVKKEFYIKQD